MMLDGAQEGLKIFEGDVMQPGSLDPAMQGCTYLIHTATAVKLTAADPQREIVDVAVQGTLNVLRSASRTGSIRRVVLTSSTFTMIGYDKPNDYVFAESDWCQDATLVNNPYGLAKTQAERTFWDFVAEHPAFEAVSINPSLIVGPVFCENHIKGSVSIVSDVIGRTYPAHPPLWHNIIDAPTVALAHINALTEPIAIGKRYPLCIQGMWWRDIARLLEDDYLVRTGELPKWMLRIAAFFDPRTDWNVLKPTLNRQFIVDGSAALKDLGIRYPDIRDVLRVTAESLVEQGYVKARRR